MHRLAIQLNFILVVFTGQWLPCGCMKKIFTIASFLNFVNVVFNVAVDHVLSNASRKCTQINIPHIAIT